MNALLTCYGYLALRELGPAETEVRGRNIPGVLRQLIERSLEARGSA